MKKGKCNRKKKKLNWKGKHSIRIRGAVLTAQAASTDTERGCLVHLPCELPTALWKLKVLRAQQLDSFIQLAFHLTPPQSQAEASAPPVEFTLLSVLKETFKISKNLIPFPHLLWQDDTAVELLNTFPYCQIPKICFDLSRLVLLLLLIN